MMKNGAIIGSVFMALVFLNGCSSVADDLPMALRAEIIVNGSDVTGGTVATPNQSDRLKLRGKFSDSDGGQNIQAAFAEYAHHSGMMMDHMGEYTLWDDGTHGDDVAHDGWFCLEDDMAHMMSMMGVDWGHSEGSHEYEFYCFDEEGNESNHITVQVNIQ